MNYHEMEKRLRAAYNHNHANEINIPQNSQRIHLHDKIDLFLTYPGYKTKPGTIDYRVMLNERSISHEDIMNDIWKKLDNGLAPDVLRCFLLDMAENGILHNQDKYRIIDEYHGYTLVELIHTIPWIALQEDFNYPMPMFQGRKMPFSRYIEAVFSHANPAHLDKKTVLARTNARGRPPEPFPFINYGVIENLR